MERLERAGMVSDDHLLYLGREHFDEFSSYAAQSNIPVEFYDISRSLALDKLTSASVRVVAGIIFNDEFPDEEEAWRTIKYAQAISAVKKFELEQEGEDYPDEEFEVGLRKVELIIGFSAISENRDVERIRNRVERYFQNPANRLRLLFLGLMSSESAAA